MDDKILEPSGFSETLASVPPENDISPAMPWIDKLTFEMRMDEGSPFSDPWLTGLNMPKSGQKRKIPLVHDRIDYAIFDPLITAPELIAACDNAKLYKMRSVTVQPDHVPLCVRKLYGTRDPRVCAIVGFPFGFGTIEGKVREVEIALQAGAHEITLVPNMSNVKNGAWGPFETEIFKIRRAAGKTAVFNLVVDKTMLSESECESACKIARRCGVSFVQTSTGYGPKVISNAGVTLMKNAYLRDWCGIIAAGGVNTLRKCTGLINAGADRLLTSYAPAICEEELFETRQWREIEYKTTMNERASRMDPYIQRTLERERHVQKRHEEYLEMTKVLRSKLWCGEKLTQEEQDSMHFNFTQERWDFDMEHLKDPDPWLVSQIIAARFTQGFHEYRYDYFEPDGIYYPFMSPSGRTERRFVSLSDNPDPEKEWRRLKHEEDRKIVNMPRPEQKNNVKFYCFTPAENKRKNVEVTEVLEKIRERNRILKHLAELEQEEANIPKYERLAKEKAERRRKRLEAERAQEAAKLDFMPD